MPWHDSFKKRLDFEVEILFHSVIFFLLKVIINFAIAIFVSPLMHTRAFRKTFGRHIIRCSNVMIGFISIIKPTHKHIQKPMERKPHPYLKFTTFYKYWRLMNYLIVKMKTNYNKYIWNKYLNKKVRFSIKTNKTILS